MPSRVKAMAYATIANLGPGFDVFGISIDAFYDVVEASFSEKLEIEISGVRAEKIPREVEKNSAGLVAKKILDDFEVSEGILLRIEKRIRAGSGLGSSSASAAACAVALNELLNLKLSDIDLIGYASIGEIASAGVAHADNVAAAILGGFVIVRYDPPSVIRLDPPKNLVFSIALPEIEFSTREARAVIPERIRIKDLVHNVGSASSLVAGILTSDIELIGRSMSDRVVEPARAKLIPGYENVKKNAMKAGACGVAISGAGPTIVSVVDEKRTDPRVVAESMKRGFEEAGVRAEVFIARPGPGSKILDVE